MQEMAAKYLPINAVPPEIIEAARLVEHWFLKQDITDWKLGGVQSRTK